MEIADMWSTRWLADRALQAGAVRRSMSKISWDISAGCRRPVVRDRFSRPPGRDVVVAPGRPIPIWCEMVMKCRNCEVCLRKRASLWRRRAMQEIAESERTWFVTLTLRPEEQYRALAAGLRKAGFDGEPCDEFRARVVEIGAWLTLALKRLRKKTGARLRYVVVYERHKTGLPHVHLLIHEQDRGGVKYADIQYMWPHGYISAKLVADNKQAGYVTKYLSKDAAARVRASVRYGQRTVSTIAMRANPFAAEGAEWKVTGKKRPEDDNLSWSIGGFNDGIPRSLSQGCRATEQAAGFHEAASSRTGSSEVACTWQNTADCRRVSACCAEGNSEASCQYISLDVCGPPDLGSDRLLRLVRELGAPPVLRVRRYRKYCWLDRYVQYGSA